MGEQPRLVAVSGGRGYVGSVLLGAFDKLGWRTISLERAHGEPPAGRTRPYDLGGQVEPDLLEGVDTLVACAWDLSLTRREDIWSVNVDGTERLLRLAREVGVRRVVLISSMSAYEGTTQLYGLAKLETEQLCLKLGGAVGRLGLVYGPRSGGMVGALRKMTRLPVTPLVAGKSLQFTVHEDDAAEAIVTMATVPEVPNEPLGIASSEPVRFEQLIRAIAWADGHRCRLVPVPWQMVYAGLRAGELLRLPLPFRADSLLGLVRPAPSVPGRATRLGAELSLRPFSL
jgi:nucleoside-diphosphate-sugar epimerase